ncbi:MAG: hypothetical protein NTZ78_05665 [Candidatus Aureabacteria bacterium]|nr:hypothetical protein [Candidatus Auribacterota bacterium]
MRKALEIAAVGLALCAVGMSAASPVSAETLSLQVSESADDGETNHSNSSWGNSYGNLTIGRDSSDSARLIDSYMRFTNVTIPNGSVITSAYLTVRSQSSRSSTVCRTRFYLEAADNATQITGYNDYQSRTMTDASAQYQVPAWTTDTDYNLPSIVDQVQAVINRAGWTSGNALQIFWKNDGSDSSSARQPYSYDGSATHAPKLTITYTLPTPTPTNTPTLTPTPTPTITPTKSMDSPGAPSAGSGLYTLSQIYDYLNSGIAATPAPSFQEPGAAPGPTMRTTKQIYDAIKAKYDQCDATAADVKSGKKFFSTLSGSWGVRTGTASCN